MSTREYSCKGKVSTLDKNGSSIRESYIHGQPDAEFRRLNVENDTKKRKQLLTKGSLERISSKESSVEILSGDSFSEATSEKQMEKLKEENEILQGKLKCYQTLGKLYQETKEELQTMKTNYSSKSEYSVMNDDFLNSKDNTYSPEYNSLNPESIPSNPPTLDDIHIEMQNESSIISNETSLQEQEIPNQFEIPSTNKDDKSEMSHSSHTDEDNIQKAISTYQEYMKQKFYGTSTLEKDVIKHEHKQAFSLAVKAAKKSCTEPHLEEILKPHYQKLVQENNTLSREKCHLLVKHIFNDIDAAIKDNTYMIENGYEKYLTDRDEAIEKYKNNPGKGPMATHVLEEYLLKRKQDEQRIQQQQLFDNDDLSMTWDDNDVMTQVQTICDTMSKGLDEPESMESLHVGKELIAFSVRAIKLEKQQKKYKTLVDTLYDENEKIKNDLQEKDDEISTLRKQVVMLKKPDIQPEETEVSETPSTSLTIPEKEWIHVVENEPAVQEGEKQYKCDEATDREIEFQDKIKKLKDRVKEFATANKNWEKHCSSIQEHFKGSMRKLMDDVSSCEEKMKLLEEEKQQMKSEFEQQVKSAEEKVQEYENQRIKAVNFASSQASKVDEMKRTIKMEQDKNKDLEDKVLQLQSILETQKEELDRLHIQMAHIKDGKEKQKSTESTVHLTMDNKPPISERVQGQQEISLRRPGERLDSMQNLNLVLQQQVTIYKEDFDKERQDRERAQSELATIRNTFGQMNEEGRHLREELEKKITENEALKAAREYDRPKLQRKQEEINNLTASLNESSRKIRDLHTKVDELKRQVRQQQQPPPYEYNPFTSPVRQQPQERYIMGPGPRIQTVQPVTEILPESWKRKIQSKITQFSMNLRPDDVVLQLYSKGIISYTDKQNIEAERTEYRRSEKLICDVVLRGTKSDLATFRQILIDTQQVELALLLPTDSTTRSTTKVREKWNCIVCTYENSGDCNMCEMCRTTAPRMGGERQPRLVPRGVEQCDNTEWVLPAQVRDTEIDGDNEDQGNEGNKTSPKMLEMH